MRNNLLVFYFVFYLLNATSCVEKSSNESDLKNLIARGEYLVTIGGCNDCHSPKILTSEGPIPDSQRLLSGHSAGSVIPKWDTITAKSWLLFSADGTVAMGPWGTSFAANITSDSTGIGGWSLEQFFNAMQNGDLHGIPGTRKLLPPMPWPNYAKMKNEDIQAIFEYLKNTKPVKNIVPAPLAPGI